MTKIKKTLLKAIFICLSLIFLNSCSREETLIASQENEVQEQVFKFEKTIKLTDGNFFVYYSIKANTQNDIDYVISLKPQIKVKKIDDEILQENTELSSVISETNSSEVTISESIINSNIPSGYMLAFYYGKPAVDEKSRLSSSYSTRVFADSGAKGIYVKQNGYTLSCVFFSKGCWSCWGGWKNRGSRTIGPSNTNSHTFNTSTYTTDPGAKMEAYTTITAWNATIKYFLY